jgi:plasmid stability protein
MATLIVRTLDDDLVRRLKARAKAHRRSAEAEHRQILQEALCPKPQMTGAEFWEALRRDGPLLDDDDEFFKALGDAHQPIEETYYGDSDRSQAR